ncbi:MAG: ABC transporter permease [Magnetospirillum sp.]|nr:ABC transporter permease [Magnetospirillum sp.]
MSALPAAAVLARRELRGGWKGFRVLVACLALGVAAIAAAGSLRAAFDKALDEDARSLLGGDLELRQSYHPLADEPRTLLAGMGRLSEGVELRAMARAETAGTRRLVELKGVDSAYPLVGHLQLAPAMNPAEAMGRRDGVWGAAADANLLAALGLKVGDRVSVGDARFQVRAVIVKEPDRVANAFAFGPRLMVASPALADTGLIQPGSLIRHVTRVVLNPGVTAAGVETVLARRFPDPPWHIRDVREAAPALGRFLDNMASFLTLVGLTALMVGGIGVANAVTAYLDGRTRTIAVLKCLGAPSRLIFATYGLLVGMLSLAGIFAGLAVGAAVPWGVVAVAGDRLPLAARVGLYPLPLAVAAMFGVLTALVFTLWPLARARRVPAAALFRQSVAPLPARGRRSAIAWVAPPAIALAALAVLSSERPALAAAFVAIAVATLALFRTLAWALSIAAARLSRRRRGMFAHPTGRLALANLHRPGGAVVGMVLSLGLGLTVLVAVAQVEGNLARQFGETLPRRAPSFFFIDIQPGEMDAFVEAVRSAAPAARIETAPLIRGRVVSVGGVPVERLAVAPQAQWVVRGDRGLTLAARPPERTFLAAGAWWPPDYRGMPLASVEAGVAKGLGLTLGDTVGLNVLGREIRVRVANLREVEWSSLDMNFAFILSPNALAGAPVTWIASVHLPPGADEPVEKAVTDRLANVSAIRVKEALESVRAMIANADLAVRLAAAVTLAAGGLVLAGAVMAGRSRRIAEAVILKVLGATRGDLWRAWLLEFGIVGTVTGLAAGAAGTAAAWAILTRVMRAEWSFLPGLAAVTLAASVGASLLAGFAGTFVALRAKGASLLRAE